MHELLAFLQAEGLRGIPRVEGTDGDQEVLTYVQGRGVPADEVVLDNVLVEAVTWLRDFHDIVEGFRPAGARRWRPAEVELEADEIVCHNDPGVHNWIIESGQFAAMIDWDMAAPGRRIDDVAYLAWTALPLDRPSTDDEVLRRLDLLVDAYGEYGPMTVLNAIAGRMQAACDRIDTGYQAGDPAMINLTRAGVPERTRAHLEAFGERLTRWESLL